MKTASLILLTSFALTAFAQDATQPPAGARVRFLTKGVGVQMYACTAKGSDYAWVFQEPQADLLNAKTLAPVGTHSKGPTWTWKDGSSIAGKVLQQQPAADAASNIPWLLLQTQSTGSKGALSHIAYVRRSDTEGGVANSNGCSSDTAGTVSKVPYKATYTFYTAGK